MSVCKVILSSVMVIFCLLGCAVNDYEYVPSGPKAKFVFFTPAFRNSFMANTYANLSINRMENNCQVHLGRIGIDRKNLSKEAYVPADEIITMTVVFRHSMVGSGFAEEYIDHIAFTPEANKEYAVKFVDSKHGPYISVSEYANKDTGPEIKVYSWEPCKQ